MHSNTSKIMLSFCFFSDRTKGNFFLRTVVCRHDYFKSHIIKKGKFTIFIKHIDVGKGAKYNKGEKIIYSLRNIQVLVRNPRSVRRRY